MWKSRLSEVRQQAIHKLAGRDIDEQPLLYLAVCVEHRGVITTAESLSDGREGVLCELTAEVHGDLASIDNLTAASGRGEGGTVEAERRGGDILDVVDGGGGVGPGR